jgi:CheY-like chemotaxis protein
MGRDESLPRDTLAGLHVLVVDDDGDARELVGTVLEYCGALVTKAASAEQALDILGRVSSDAIVCDIAMPGRDGYWLLAQLRRSGRPSIPVVAITAHGALHGPDRTLVAGFDAHIRKPIDPWELTGVLAALTRRL